MHSAIEFIPYPISQTNIYNGLFESKRNMAHRTILTERQRAALFDLPTSEAEIHRHYTPDDNDIEPPNLLWHISALGRAHILRTGEYRWPKNQGSGLA